MASLRTLFSQAASTVSLAYIMTFVITCAAPMAEAHTVVVVNARNPVRSLTRAEVADIFLARVSAFPNGADATPLDQHERSAIRDAFYRDISGKSPAQLKAYWSTLIFTGRGEPPRAVNDAESVKKELAGMPTAVGYMDDSAVDASVKVVLVLP